MANNGVAAITTYDAVLIPGGGFSRGDELYASVCARLDRALTEPGRPVLIPLSGGTVHKPPPLDDAGFPITEADAAARYLMNRGCDRDRILPEEFSRDTIGNAYFARTLHTQIAGYRKLLVVTSEFHMPRTEAVFRHIFGIDPCSPPYQLDFASTPDIGYSPQALNSRKEREAKSLKRWQANMQQLPTLDAVHRWLFTQHTAYAAGVESKLAGNDAIETY